MKAAAGTAEAADAADEQGSEHAAAPPPSRSCESDGSASHEEDGDQGATTIRKKAVLQRIKDMSKASLCCPFCSLDSDQAGPASPRSQLSNH